MTESEIEALIAGIYSGSINTRNLPVNLYSEYVERFSKGVGEVFGSVVSEEEKALRAQLYENIQLFSGAKTYQEVKDFESFLTEGGNALSFKDFREKVLEKYKLYNTTWLSTEFLFTVESARAGKQWVGIWANREVFPMLKYVTVGDSLVRESHKVLDGVIRPVTDAFWNSYYPPWSWRCRCTTKSLESGDATTIMNKIVILPKIKNFFKNNVGKTGKIFNGFHPYFKEVPERDKEWAKKNFGLPFIKLTKDKWDRPSSKSLE
jgi:SPP1 gp7 family putative phage head morphogenesis protein